MTLTELCFNMPLATANENRELFRVVLTIVAVVILAASFIYLTIVHTFYWDRGVFPPFMRFNRTNHYEAVLQLTRNVIRHDKDAYNDKVDLACEHLRKWFPDVRGAAKNELGTRKSEFVSSKSVGYWLNKRMLSENEKHILFEYLFRVAVADGVIGQREYAELKVLACELNLSEAILDQLVETFRAGYAERVFEEQERQRRRTVISSEQQRQKALQILGLIDDSDAELIRKAYRKLVMKWHPDVVSLAVNIDREHAKHRFLEIQQAYEYLLETQ